jgi:heme/copper-type cytochrome/quinol oxidase subunit 1
MTTIDTHATSAAAPAGAGIASVADWVTTTDHKKIGRLYLGTAGVSLVGSLVVAGLLAFERINTDTTVLPIESLTQLFSVYRFGLTYMVMLPLMIGAALSIVPLQVGARSVAFPRVAATGFWAWLVGSITSVVSIASNGGPNGGNKVFVDLFMLSSGLAILGLLATTVSLATTILTTRAPGMNMRRLPWFTWSVLIMSLALLVALPILLGDLLVLFIGHKYPSVSDLSGNRTIQDWAAFGFTQPTTIIFAIPALGLLADTVATATGRRLVPRGAIYGAIALVGTAMYGAAVQSPVIIRSGFRNLSGGDKLSDLLPFALVHVLPLAGAFLAVALSAQALRKKPRLIAPLVFGLLAAILVVEGAAGSALNHIGDAGLVGTTFEEGTWLALVYAAVLAGMGAVAYWGPKLWGRSMPLKATLPLALLGFVGAALASVPMMIAGFADQPGGVFPAVDPGVPGVVLFDYSGPAALWNTLSLVGHAVALLAVLAFLGLAVRSFAKGEFAGDDPFDGQTLEWATTSPAPANNFVDIHIVQSAEPLLDLKTSNRSDA